LVITAEALFYNDIYQMLHEAEQLIKRLGNELRHRLVYLTTLSTGRVKQGSVLTSAANKAECA
jgi:archaellum biogenesis protein FlaJ (TadC family)